MQPFEACGDAKLQLYILQVAAEDDTEEGDDALEYKEEA
jgi:hypothetical protein